MNDFMFDRRVAIQLRATTQVRAADLTGKVWEHSNPVVLYRWIARRNDLLRTIAEAFPPPSSRSMAS